MGRQPPRPFRLSLWFFATEGFLLVEDHFRQTDRLTTIRLRMVISRELEDRGITAPAEIDVALGMPAVEATSLRRCGGWG